MFPKALISAGLDAYEAAARVVTEFEWALARSLPLQPLSSVTATWADLTRDAAAVQLSTLRWTLDL